MRNEDNSSEYPYISIDVSFMQSTVGTEGSAGGYIFYDVDEDNNEENDGAGPDGLMSSTCNWKFLETAPSEDFADNYVWSGQAFNISGTSEEIGKGDSDTQRIIDIANLADAGTEDYAALVCKNYKDDNGNKDYFLPSLNELEKIRLNLFAKNSGGFSSSFRYWSSSEKACTNRM